MVSANHSGGEAAVDDSSLYGNLFSSFTSLGNSAFHETELNNLFKTEFGINLDNLTESDTFANITNNNNPTNSFPTAHASNNLDSHQNYVDLEAQPNATIKDPADGLFAFDGQRNEPDFTASTLVSNK